MFTEADGAFMRRALRLAERGWGRVHPNPLVGALVVRAGTVVGEGWHVEFGGPHAEVVALRAAGELAHGATLYVTLEPCAHHGKTPPCTEAIAAAGIARVVYGGPDPNPDAAGGARILQAAGIMAEGGLLADPARRLNAAFYHAHATQSPWLAVKLALSLDGRIARRPGKRTTLSGPEATAWVHWLRAGFDALVIGGRTAAVDDPMLTVRGVRVPRRPPARVVVGSVASVSTGSALVRTIGDAPVWLVTPEDPESAATLEDLGVRVLRVGSAVGGVAPREAVSVLWREGVRSILCEGGARWAGALLAAALVQRIYLLVAPRVLGDEGVLAFPAGLGGEWQVIESRRIGVDGLLILERAVPRGW